MAVRKGVESGLTVAQPLKESGVFPPMVVQMIGVGEQTGALDAMLGKIADFYEDEVDQAVANLLTLMEPVMILFLGHHRRRHRHRDVPAAVRPHQQADLRARSAWLALARRRRRRPPAGDRMRRPRDVTPRDPRGPPQAADALPGGHGDHPALHRHLRRGGLRDASLPVNPLYFVIVATYALTVVHAVALRFVPRAGARRSTRRWWATSSSSPASSTSPGEPRRASCCSTRSRCSRAASARRRRGRSSLAARRPPLRRAPAGRAAGPRAAAGPRRRVLLPGSALVYSVFVLGVACAHGGPPRLLPLGEPAPRGASGSRRRRSRWPTCAS